jgi:exonuclease III
VKIVSWNCNGGLRNKTHALDSLEADIFIIQECEDPSNTTDSYRKWCENYLWSGLNKNRGIGVFARNGFSIQKVIWYNEIYLTCFFNASDSLRWNTKQLQQFLPFIIDDDLIVIAVWTKQAESKSFGYIGQAWKYIQLHRKEISENRNNLLMCGDFNSSAIWDEAGRWWNHSDVVYELDQLGLKSLYHEKYNESHGKEKQHTFFLHRNPKKHYHIDNCFISAPMITNAQISIESIGFWLKHSDHLPLIINI